MFYTIKIQRIIKSINKAVKKVLPQNHVTQNVYESKKLGSYFNIKDSTKLEHQHDLTYFTQTDEVNCKEPEGCEKEPFNMLEKTENPTWINIA